MWIQGKEGNEMTTRKKVVLLGFFGRGNAGDEAFLHVQYQLFSKDFDICIVIEQKGAYPGFSTWDPYNQCEIWSFDDVNRLYSKDIAFLHIGGGSLPFAYAGHFILSAFDYGIPVLMSGIDASIKPKSADDDIKKVIYSRLAFMSVRTDKSYSNLSKHSGNLNIHHGADWALGLSRADTGISDVDIVVTTRGFSEPSSIHQTNRSDFEHFLTSNGRRITWLPFAPDDRRFLLETGVDDQDILNLWHDPRQVLDVICKSKLTVSIGRLHTLIFASMSNIPCVAIDPFIVHDGKHIPNRKNMFFCKEHGIPFYNSIRNFIDEFNLEDIGANNLPGGFTQGYLDRFGSMIERLSSYGQPLVTIDD
ncbi:polysaccharide pyruvyl transferase family protein [Cyanobium sp. Morenito 9A2]|uniref:polysaccharide pyruvyl transferase family protein n=1 Tax=Cyanobium sp. Morenito 9A2 TaxID=2823718 RepID=UPI0020CC78FA|nr:polysaccharide pyruvyl transferase family protein [Cyanobium sp. Morenito 9A2]MCP9848319.1 polysaccharide pyruvyl transferase family protein [Cyanobium sp. Morenito 9A2]